MPPDLRPPASPILVLDCDGVLTDGGVWVADSGESFLRFDRRDGRGIRALRDHGVWVIVVTRSADLAIRRRVDALDVDAVLGCDDKIRPLLDRGIDLTAVVAIGDDVDDMPLLRAAAVGVVPADAHPEARAAADWVVSRPGGHGAVREVCDWILEDR